MTRSEVMKIYYYEGLIERLQETINELEARRAQLEDSMLRSPKLDGMPRATQGKSDPTANAAAAAAEIKTMIDDQIHLMMKYKAKIERKRMEILEYITRLDDPQLVEIIMLKCLRLYTWEQVAAHIGGNNTAGSVRGRFDRHFNRKM